MEKIVSTGFESVKQYLLERGYVQKGDNSFKKENKQSQSMIINGQRMNREYTISQVITYLGEGELFDEHKSESLAGFRVEAFVEDELQGNSDIYVRDFREFVDLIRLS